MSIETLVDSGLLTWPQLIEKMSLNPARILGIPKGTLSVGADADVVVIDPTVEWDFVASEMHSKSKNSPYLGRRMKGRAVATIVAGEIRFDRR